MWNYFEPENLRWYRWNLDGATAWLRKNGEEWRLAVEPVAFKQIHQESGGPEESEEPDSLIPSYIVASGRKVALRPRLSSRPYLVSARNNVRLLPGAAAWFSIALPPRLRFELENGQVLLDSEPFTVSNTWFGDKTAGDLCLSLPIELDPECKGENEAGTSACDTANQATSKYLGCRSLVLCNLVVKNRSKEAIDLKRLAIFTDLLNLYEKEDRLVTDTVVVVGTADGSLQTNIDDSEYRKLRKIHAAEKSGLSEVLVRHGVSFLRSITGI